MSNPLIGKFYQDQDFPARIYYWLNQTSFFFIAANSSPFQSINFIKYQLDEDWKSGFIQQKPYPEINEKVFYTHPNKELRLLAQKDSKFLEILENVTQIKFINNSIFMVDNEYLVDVSTKPFLKRLKEFGFNLKYL